MLFANLADGKCFRFRNPTHHGTDVFTKIGDAHYRLAKAGIHACCWSINSLPKKTFEEIDEIRFTG